MFIRGERVVLRPAVESDRQKIFEWLTASDLTKYMMGPPNYPESKILSWEEFCEDFTIDFFKDTGNEKGRCFIIFVDREEVGTLCYDLFDREKDRVVLDIWMKSEGYCGKGYGPEALNILCEHINKTYGISTFQISPSARNPRAVASYVKAGFKFIKKLTVEDQQELFDYVEYSDNILLEKKL